VTIIVCGTKMHQRGVEVHYFGRLSPSNCDDSVNDCNLFVMETGNDSETLNSDPAMTRLVVVEETG
jgi:hypothetical protein